MKNESSYHFPKVIIQKITSLLERNEEVYASELTMKFGKEKILKAYENMGQDFSSISIEKEYEALIEMTRGEIHYSKEFAPDDAIQGTYLWSEMLYVFFPELVEIRDKMDDAYGSHEDELDDLFEEEATRIFQNWGINGLNIGVYVSKPMLATEFGVILINEYQFEEDVDEWDLDLEIWIEPAEFFLRGISPLKSQERGRQ